MFDFTLDFLLHSYSKRKLDLSFIALHPLMSSFKLYSMKPGKGESSWKDKANFNALAKTRYLNCLCKTVQLYIEGSDKWESYYSLRSCYHVIWAAINNRVCPMTTLQMANGTHGTWDLASVAKVGTNVFCLMIPAGWGFPWARWLLGPDSLLLCLSTGNAYCCAKQHYFGSFNHYKKEQKKCKIQFSFNRKARVYSHPIPSFFLLPPFFFQFHPLHFFNWLPYCF